MSFILEWSKPLSSQLFLGLGRLLLFLYKSPSYEGASLGLFDNTFQNFKCLLFSLKYTYFSQMVIWCQSPSYSGPKRFKVLDAKGTKWVSGSCSIFRKLRQSVMGSATICGHR